MAPSLALRAFLYDKSQPETIFVLRVQGVRGETRQIHTVHASN